MRHRNKEQANRQFRLGEEARGKSTARWPRAAASATAAGVMNESSPNPRRRARRQDRGSERIRERNPHLRAGAYTRPTTTRRGDIPIRAFHLARCAAPVTAQRSSSSGSVVTRSEVRS